MFIFMKPKNEILEEKLKRGLKMFESIHISTF